MGAPPPSGLPEPPQPSQGLSDQWWWVPNAIGMLAGLAMIALGVYDHDNQALVLTGTGVVTAALGHAAGKQSPTP